MRKKLKVKSEIQRKFHKENEMYPKVRKMEENVFLHMMDREEQENR